jgi:signal transduction histidine kinase
MSNQSLDTLQEAIKKLSGPGSAEEKLQALTIAFDHFTKQTARLEGAYCALKEQFQSVNHELEESNRKLNEKVAELDFSSCYLDSILSNISQGIIFIDLSGSVTTYNAAAEAILEKSRNQVLFYNFWDNFADDIFGFSMKEAFSRRTTRGNTIVSLHAGNGKSAKELEIGITFVLQENVSTEKTAPEILVAQGMILLVRDITEIRRLQMIANRNDRLKELGEMAAQVAHEIRNPLGGIKGFASLLKRDLTEQPEMCQMAQYIIEGTDNLNKLVTNVLNYSRPVQLQFITVDVNQLITELVHHFQADELLKDNIQIKVRYASKKIMIQADPQYFKSALLNLLVNSVQAMPEGGEITLSVDQEDDTVIIKIRDSGVGISPGNMEKIFSPFFSTKVQGNGFGLAEVYKVIQAHGATIEADSEENKWTIFTIKIPANRNKRK